MSDLRSTIAMKLSDTMAAGVLDPHELTDAVLAAAPIIAADAEQRVRELLHTLEFVKSVLDENRFVGDNNPFGIRDIVGAALYGKGTPKCSTP